MWCHHKIEVGADRCYLGSFPERTLLCDCCVPRCTECSNVVLDRLPRAGEALTCISCATCCRCSFVFREIDQIRTNAAMFCTECFVRQENPIRNNYSPGDPSHSVRQSESLESEDATGSEEPSLVPSPRGQGKTNINKPLPSVPPSPIDRSIYTQPQAHLSSSSSISSLSDIEESPDSDENDTEHALERPPPIFPNLFLPSSRSSTHPPYSIDSDEDHGLEESSIIRTAASIGVAI